MERPTLILDADDTLWENNVFYEEINQAFAERMTREGFDRQEARQTLDAVEHERVPIVGYSPEEFVRSLVIAYRRLCQRHDLAPHPEIESQVEAIGRHIFEYPINLMDGVIDTLPRLHERYRLIVLTKGDPQIQRDKVRRSGLASYFEAVHVVPEKGPEVLEEILDHHDLDPERTWMVGNSPRSDINPALRVGIGAVYIPYSVPWSYEETAIAQPDRVITLDSFAGLTPIFLESEAPG